MAERSGEESAPEIPIRDAACVVVVDSSGSVPRLLMGRRHSDQVFLPNKWVFPGGRVENEDRRFADAFPGTFSPCDLAHEIKPFALAGIRELFEETGLLIGGDGASLDPGPAWQIFATAGRMPAPEHLSPLARAITPPGRVRRYDTWFFLAGADALSTERAATDGELLDLGWFTPDEAYHLDLPRITQLVLNDVASIVRSERSSLGTAAALPYYYSDGTSFRRDLISCKVAPPMP
jgi:8-oxo-dGTP pyrophosphatase MutT (NUDIX family)